MHSNTALPEAAGLRCYRTLFISDFHLGTRFAEAAPLVRFLEALEAQTIYLVGDIVDFWRIDKHRNWPQSHSDVITTLLRKAREGTRLILIPGNHDESLRTFAGQMFHGVEVRLNDIHTTRDGRRFFITHGDECDVVVQRMRWLAHLGDAAYASALWVNRYFNVVRRRAGMGYWSVSAFLKRRVKKAVNTVFGFETKLVSRARAVGADGVICGHVHEASMRRIEDMLYVNCGDWVESCTAAAELLNGEIRIVRINDEDELVLAEDQQPEALTQAA